jgi:hypothetical protein
MPGGKLPEANVRPSSDTWRLSVPLVGRYCEYTVSQSKTHARDNQKFTSATIKNAEDLVNPTTWSNSFVFVAK